MSTAASRLHRRHCLRLGLASAWMATGCGRTEPQGVPYQPRYASAPALPAGRESWVLGVHPLHNPAMLFQRYGPLVDYLRARLPGLPALRLEASRDYADFNRKLKARRFQLALPNPYQTLMALDWGYRVFAKMGDDDNFRGVLVVRRDSPVRQPADLRGKTVSFPAPTALAATLLPQRFLHDHGLPWGSYQAVYVGSQESSIMQAVLGGAAASATWIPPWLAFCRHQPERARELRLIWTTPSLPNNSLVARDDVPDEAVERITRLLLDMHRQPQGRALLAELPLSCFEPATRESYAPVSRFLREFTQLVRPLEPER